MCTMYVSRPISSFSMLHTEILETHVTARKLRATVTIGNNGTMAGTYSTVLSCHSGEWVTVQAGNGGYMYVTVID